MTVAEIHRAILAVWRVEQPRLITSLARMLRDVSLAEDLTQEALLAALERWPEATMRCDKCKREMSDDELAWRLWRSFSLCAGCKPDTYFRPPEPCARCGRPVHEHDTEPSIVYCGTRCQELMLPAPAKAATCD